MITIGKDWNCGWFNFPTGTTFIPKETTKKGVVYSYVAPGHSHGEVFIDKGKTPGVDNA